MRLHSHPDVVRLRRHDLISINADAWTSVVGNNPCLRSEPLVAEWIRCGWPLIIRRPTLGEASGIAVGLPLPPSDGKKRLAFTINDHQINSVDPPPSLSAVYHRAPSDWVPTLWSLRILASRHNISARVFGSLGWSVITGLDYVTPSSDFDFLLYLHRTTDVGSLLSDLASIQSVAPMRMDGELVRDDGAAVNWRELHGATGDVLVKSISEAKLCSPAVFLDAGVQL